jgi:hypothetical protein
MGNEATMPTMVSMKVRNSPPQRPRSVPATRPKIMNGIINHSQLTKRRENLTPGAGRSMLTEIKATPTTKALAMRLPSV